MYPALETFAEASSTVFPSDSLLKAIRIQLGLQALIVTLGAEGYAYTDQQDAVLRGKPQRAITVADTVGAGDAFSAVFLLGLLNQWPAAVILNRAQAFAGAICEARVQPALRLYIRNGNKPGNKYCYRSTYSIPDYDKRDFRSKPDTKTGTEFQPDHQHECRFFWYSVQLWLAAKQYESDLLYLGADEASLPYLWLAGPVTGLIVQPLIGAMSDRTVSRWGRRSPYFLIGAILCSLGLLAMPYSPALWVAASLLWILDAANNVTMEPYRAFVSDKLDASQHSVGFLTQSAFTGLGQTLAYLTPSILVWLGMNKDAVNAHHIPHIVIAAFLIGAFFSLASILWTLKTTPEIPLTEQEIQTIRSAPSGWRTTLRDIKDAFREMPPTMKQLALVKLFQWYAMFCYWQYIVLSLGRTIFHTSDPASAGFREAGLLNGKIGAFYNLVAFFAAFALIPFYAPLWP
jgi:MFS family permease